MFRWFKIFNRTEFAALGLVSKTYTKELTGIGQKDILVTQGNCLGMLYDEVFLALDINGNPFEFEDHAIYVDEADDVYLGIAVAE